MRRKTTSLTVLPVHKQLSLFIVTFGEKVLTLAKSRGSLVRGYSNPETIIFQGMYWCAHKTATLTSIQHTVGGPQIARILCSIVLSGQLC